jgi:hypothetical protein
MDHGPYILKSCSLASGVTTLLFQSTPTYPNPGLDLIFHLISNVDVINSRLPNR